ncbi:KRI1-like family C-terminal-domain-containing protein [Myxozyma melibiosi]|uniref:KRI1-like family C-terminal-domain-containing protein n=1 Tax=Myxozyma melibiosi TaxID=54550 RepID=A0ABR1FD06_9ASCO
MPRVKKSKAKKAELAAKASKDGAQVSAATKPATVEENGKGESNGKRKRLELSDDDESEDDGEIKLKVNAEYKKRFEHNKEREELHRLKERAKRGELDSSDSDAESSSSEEEDENAELLTDEVDMKIQQVVQALRSNDPSVVKNPDVRFFDDESFERTKKDKPVYLRDYHRMNLLGQLDEGATADGEEEQDESKLPYSVKLARDRAQLVREMHESAENDGDNGNNSDDEGEDDFLMKPVEKERKIEPIELPDPAEDPERFLDTFMNSKAWLESAPIRRKKKPSVAKDKLDDQAAVSEEDDSDFDDRAEEFETKYNFRFEAGEEAGQVVSYGRDVVAAHSIRREDETARQRARRLKKEAKEQAKKEREADRHRYKQLKVKEVMEKIAKIKQVAGLDEDEDLPIGEEDLEADFDENDWDERMKKAFGDNFYGKKDTKPVWNDDIDITDIVPDYKSDSEAELDEGGEVEDEKEEVEEEEKEEETPKLSKRQQKKLEQKAKEQAKEEAKKLKSKVEEFVDTQILPFADDDEIAQTTGKKDKKKDKPEPKKSDEPEFKFRYREVSPESFNLEPADILLADDKALNEFIGLKKLAPYREPEKKAQDHKRFAKKKRLRQWRKEVFGDAAAPKWEERAPLIFGDANGASEKKKKHHKKHKKQAKK